MTENKAERTKRRAAKRSRVWNRRNLLLPLLFLLLLLLAFKVIGNNCFEITVYRLDSDQIDEQVRMVLMSDLHSVEYGEGNCELIEAVREAAPDLILMAGDMVNQDDQDLHVIRHLCRELVKIAPVYYSMGNHEGTMTYGRQDSIAIDRFLEEDGVCVLYNQTTEFTKGNTTLQIAGISTSESNYDKWSKSKLEDFWQSDDYKILISHYPSLYYEKLYDADMDLAVAGHYHGGIIRIPGLGGLYHPKTGFFPKYDGGKYELAQGTLIVTRGIGNHGLIPRINNRPELVIIDVE